MKKFSFIILIVVVLNGCSNSPLFYLDSDSEILAFGDSLTAGVGVKINQSYPSQLAKRISMRVINAGVSGEVTSDGLIRFRKLLDNSNPDLIILLEGGNDILRNLPLSQTKNNLAQMIEFAISKEVPIILIGVPQKNLFSNSAKIYSELAEEYNLVLDDEIIADLIRSPSMKSDSVHFNKEGYGKLAEKIHQLIVDSSNL